MNSAYCVTNGWPNATCGVGYLLTQHRNTTDLTLQLRAYTEAVAITKQTIDRDSHITSLGSTTAIHRSINATNPDLMNDAFITTRQAESQNHVVTFPNSSAVEPETLSTRAYTPNRAGEAP